MPIEAAEVVGRPRVGLLGRHAAATVTVANCLGKLKCHGEIILKEIVVEVVPSSMGPQGPCPDDADAAKLSFHDPCFPTTCDSLSVFGFLSPHCLKFRSG